MCGSASGWAVGVWVGVGGGGGRWVGGGGGKEGGEAGDVRNGVHGAEILNDMPYTLEGCFGTIKLGLA